jgi:hypothetical protein
MTSMGMLTNIAIDYAASPKTASRSRKVAHGTQYSGTFFDALEAGANAMKPA